MFDFTYIYILTVIALIILITIIRRSSYIEERKNRFFIFAIFCDIIVLLGYIGRSLAEQYGLVFLAHLSSISIYLFAPLSLLFMAVASAKKIGKVIKMCFVLEAISIFLALSSPFFGFFYSVSENAIYSRGPFFAYNEVIGIVYIAVWWVYSFIEFGYVEPIDKFYLSELFVLQICSVILQGLHSTYKVMYICGAFVVMIYYAFVTEANGKYDKMTGVRNRLCYQTILQNKEDKKRYSVIMFDADGLKKINDTLGHESGDKLICAIAKSVTKAVGRNGLVYRIGGDEFVAIINSCDNDFLTDIDKSAHNNLSELAKECDFELSASSGVAVYNDGEELSETVKRADKKMYENKNQYYLSKGIEKRV
ncbi:MAG: GGDEF domain-containing protein [Oscillospiraceae bacterium]